MNISEYTKLPKNTYVYDVWQRKTPVKTSLGSFHVELHTPDDKNSPDDEMLRLAGELVAYVENQSEYVWDIIFGSYRNCATNADADWLECCDVPEDLTRDQVHEYCEPALCISRQDDDDRPYLAEICVFPQWDEEHGLTLEFRDGAIATADGSPFKLVDGILQDVAEE